MSIQDEYTLRCDLCHFDLCWRCATVPEKIWHMSDDEHPLTLWWNQMVVSWVPQERDEIWCDVCEAELDPINWFFTCFDCEVTLMLSVH